MFTAQNTCAQNVACVFEVVMISITIDECILEGSHLNAVFVANSLMKKNILRGTAEFTVERNHANVICVTRHSASLEA